MSYAMPSRKRIAHLIVRLDTGGAEKSLFRLIRHTRRELEHEVLCLGPASPISADIESLGVTVHAFDYPRVGLLALWRAWRRLRRLRPDVLQGWMYLGNLFASILSLGLPTAAIVWNIRNSPEILQAERLRTRVAMQLARLPGLTPDHVIYNSAAAVSAHAGLGYNKVAHDVIVNGIDVDEYQTDDEARRQLRDDCGVGEALWVGMVCRYHPLKGVADFLAAGAALRRDHPGIRLMLAGPGMTAENAALGADIAAAGLQTDAVDLLGPLTDVVPVLSALDLLVLASHREGTPNILLEAMAAGLMTVATRVGDVPRILEDERRLVAPGNVDELKTKMIAALDAEDTCARQQAERARVMERYGVRACMDAYLDTYARVHPA